MPQAKFAPTARKFAAPDRYAPFLPSRGTRQRTLCTLSMTTEHLHRRMHCYLPIDLQVVETHSAQGASSGSAAYVRENAVPLSLTLTSQELRMPDAAFPVRPVDTLRSLLDRSKRWLRSFGNAQ
jgi:hypothetical protein